jgi:serine/threonine protein kinase
MQSILRHPNIALLMGVVPKIPNIVIAFEYMPGSLYNLLHLKKTIQLQPEVKLRIARDVARTFYYMHSLGIVHRDIKSHNILVDDSFNIKVCDFGLARFKVSSFHQIKMLFRLTLARARCSFREPLPTWRLSFSRSVNMTIKLISSPLERSYGR